MSEVSKINLELSEVSKTNRANEMCKITKF